MAAWSSIECGACGGLHGLRLIGKVKGWFVSILYIGVYCCVRCTIDNLGLPTVQSFLVGVEHYRKGESALSGWLRTIEQEHFVLVVHLGIFVRSH